MIIEILKEKGISFEFFPPKSDDAMRELLRGEYFHKTMGNISTHSDLLNQSF